MSRLGTSRWVIIKNLIAQTVSMLGRTGTLTLVSLVIARFWGAESYGRYSAVIAYVMLFSFAVDWGLQHLVVREIARDTSRINTFVSTGMFLIIGGTLASTLVIFLLDHWLDITKDEPLLLFLASLWMIFGVLGLFFSGVFYALEKMEYDTWTVLAEGITVMGLLGLLIAFAETSLMLLMAILVLSRVANVGVSIWIYRRHVGKFIWKPDWQAIRGTFLVAIPFGMQILLGMFGNVLIVILNQTHGDVITGYFKAAQTIIILLLSLAILWGNVLYPRLSRAFQQAPDTYRHLLGRGLHYTFVVSFPATLGLYLLADRLIPVFYGAGYEQTVHYLRLLSFILPIGFASTVVAIAVTAADRQKERILFLMTGAVINILLGFWLIPAYSGEGAGIAQITGRLTSLVLFALLAHRVSGWGYAWRQLLPLTGATLLMGLFIHGAGNLPLWIIMPGAALIYGAVLLGTDKTVRHDLTPFLYLLTGKPAKKGV